jgi:hypothetical protein
VGTVARTAVVAGTATAVVGGVRGHQQKKAYQQQELADYEAQQQQAAMDAAAAQAVAQQQAAMQAAQPAAPAPAPAGSDDTMAQLEKLVQLQQAGALTPEEFAAAKAKLLGA